MNQAKANRYYHRQPKWHRGLRFTNTQAQGFTLTEVLVVVVIAGVLAAIAAPGWLIFMNRQRLGAAQTELLQVLREAQKKSITSRTTYGIEIAADKKTIRKFTTKDSVNGAIRYTGDTLVIGSGDDDNLEVLTSDGRTQIAFNFDGSVADSTTNLIVRSADQPDAPRCIVIETILGAMREDSGKVECEN